MINLVWLRTFCTLADIGHFTHTAQKLFMTQSGVSQHIKKLEQHLDTPLLIREGKSFSLTESGKTLHKKGLQLLKSSEEIEATVTPSKTLEGNINIASPGSIGLKLYPHLLDIQQKHPELAVNFSFAPNDSIEQSLSEQTLDIGLLTKLSHNPKLISKEVAQEPLVLVTSSAIKDITWPLLLELGMISHPDAHHHAQQLLSKNFSSFEHIDQFKHQGFSNQISLILEPVARELGFTVLPLYAVQAFKNQHEIHIQPLTHAVSETLYLCQNRYCAKSQRIEYISSHIESILQNAKR